MIEQLRRLNEQIRTLPEPVAYIVLDHSWSHRLPVVKGRDAQGRLYVLASPAVLDEMRHERGPRSVLAPPVFGVPIYRRENMCEGWPDA